MADAIGPCSTLPGDSHPVPPGQMCDEHPDRPAMARIQGETDSFGAELNDLCQECVNDAKVAEQLARDSEAAGTAENYCEHCNATISERVYPTRDPDEGMAGPVYELCASHRKKLLQYHSQG